MTTLIRQLKALHEQAQAGNETAFLKAHHELMNELPAIIRALESAEGMREALVVVEDTMQRRNQYLSVTTKAKVRDALRNYESLNQ